MNMNEMINVISPTKWEETLRSGVLFKQNIWRFITPFELPKKEFDWLKDECFKQKGKSPMNDTLIGHIKEEYNIPEVNKDFEKYIIKSCFSGPTNEYINKLSVYNNPRPIRFHKGLWCNFQKKHEFNPPHIHSGLFSFVVFIQIPYNLEDEMKVYPDIVEKEHIKIFTSKFSFLNSDGNNLVIDPISVDKSFEGKGFIFPSNQHHAVYPFYTSDGYRITVSGNLRFQVPEMTKEEESFFDD